MNSPAVLLTNFYNGESLRILEELVPDGLKLIVLEKPDREEVIKKVGQADYMIAGGTVKIDREILENAPRLKMIQRSGVGLDVIDQEELKKREIPLYRNEGINARSVAEHTLLLMLSVLRQVVKADQTTRSGMWLKRQFGIQNMDLYGKTVGLLGLGKIGEHVARLLVPFGVTVLYHKRNRLSPSDEKKLQVAFADFSTLINSSDIISIHCSYNKKTHHLICQKEFENMKPGAILINTARGKIVNEIYLYEYLKNGKMAGAGLDVFEVEPARENPLFGLDNVVVSPHIAGVTKNTFSRIYSEAFNNIVSFHRGDLKLLEEKRVV